MCNALKLFMFAGARKGEVLSATWNHFDLERGVWTKPSDATKQQKTEHVPLSEAAVDLLTSLPHENHLVISRSQAWSEDHGHQVCMGENLCVGED